MNDADLSRAADILLFMANQAQREYSESFWTEYLRGLSDLPGVEVVAALERLKRSSKFFPTVAEVRGEVAAQMGHADPGGDAWLAVEEWVRLPVGSRGHFSEVFSAEVIETVRKVGGFKKLVLADPYALSQARKDFVGRYPRDCTIPPRCAELPHTPVRQIEHKADRSADVDALVERVSDGTRAE